MGHEMTQSAGTSAEQPEPSLNGITPHREFLEDRMDPDFGLLDKLLKCAALTRRDLSRVKARNTFQERNAELLDHIARQHRCKELIAALEDTRQGHLVKYLKENGKYNPDFDGNWPLTEAELSIFDTNQESLVDLIETDDLMSKLLANGIINSRQKDFIAARSTPYEKNECLIEILRRRSLRDYRKTIQCLHDSNQSHVAEIFESEGGIRHPRRPVAPDLALWTDETLTDSPSSPVDAQSTSSASSSSSSPGRVRDCDPCTWPLVGSTEAPRASTLRPPEWREEKGHSRGRLEGHTWTNRRLRGAVRVVVAVHANLSEEDVVDVLQAEEEIAAKIAALLQTRTEDESKRILGDIMDMVDAKLIGGKVGHSVVLYFLCRRDSGLRRLRQLWTSGRLAQMTETLFNRLLLGRDRFEVKVRWTDSDYCRSKAFFQDRGLTDDKSCASKTTIYELPLELHDMILKNVCLLHMMVKTNGQRTQIRDKDLFTSLASVEFCWFQRLKRHRFKSTLLRHITVLSRKVSKRKAIVRNNRDYLCEFIQPKDLIVRLRRSDCLTDQQTRSIRRRHQTRTMNEELVDFVRKLDSHRYSTAIECLRRKKQRLVARVFEEGGVSVKVSLLSEEMANLRLAEQEIAATFSELRDKRRPMSRSLEKFLKEMKSSDVEFLNISYDRGVNMWVLCKSSNGLQNLKDALETTRFRDDLTELFRQISLSSDERIHAAVRPSTVVMETSQFSKELAVCSASVKLVTKFQVPADYIYGITKLHDNVYVLCQSPNSVIVFRGQIPFDLLETIEIAVIQKPEDIGASQRDACLYISDSGNKCVWKRTTEDDVLVMWLSNVDWPFTLSVSGDGQVLIARKGQPSVMELYGHDSVLVECISMPTDIIDPLHGVQTTTGNLVISHWYRDSVTEGVCELNRDGQVVRRFMGGKGKSQELTFPRYLTLDADDRMFVTDFDDNRIVMLDSDLSWIRVLLTKDEDAIEYPERLCFDKKKKQLMVGHVDGVNVYTLEFG